MGLHTKNTGSRFFFRWDVLLVRNFFIASMPIVLTLSYFFCTDCLFHNEMGWSELTEINVKFFKNLKFKVCTSFSLSRLNVTLFFSFDYFQQFAARVFQILKNNRAASQPH